MVHLWMRYAGLVLAILWAGWWVFFASADAIVSHRFGPAIVFAVVMISVMIGAVAIAWKWPAIGGVLLIVEGLASIAIWAPMWMRRFPAWEIISLFASMPIPPVAAGVLLLLSRNSRVSARPSHA